MSPWRMTKEWGIPTFYLQGMAYECAKRLATRGEWTPDQAMAGGFSTEDHVFKVLAMGVPYLKAVCMGRALMIPGFVGSNIEGVVGDGSRPGLWNELPTPVKKFGQTPEEIFVDKLKTGLTQFMAGARSFRLDTLNRSDIVALTEEAAKVSGIQYTKDAFKEEAERILDS